MDLIDVVVLDEETRRTLPQYLHKGRVYLEARNGKGFLILIRRLISNRGPMEIVVSVDGLGINTLEPASFANRGEILLPLENRAMFDHYQVGPLLSVPFAFGETQVRPGVVAGQLEAQRGVIGIAIFELAPKPGARTEFWAHENRSQFFERKNPLSPDQLVQFRYEDTLSLWTLGVPIPVPAQTRELAIREGALAFVEQRELAEQRLRQDIGLKS